MTFKGLKVKPYDYQVKGAQYALDHHYSINADEMGLGKTLQALMVHSSEKNKTVIVCPAYLKRNWKSEIEKSLVAPGKVVIVSNEKDAINCTDFDICIIGYPSLKYAHRQFVKTTLVVADEIHFLKNPKAKRTQMFHSLLEGRRPKRFLGLTGSPIKNRIPEFYSLLCLCSYNQYRTSGWDVLKKFSYYKFQEAFCFMNFQPIGKGRKIKKFHGMRNIEVLRKYLQGKFIRRTADKVLELPDIIEKDVLVSFKEDKELADAWESHRTGTKGTHGSTAKRQSAMGKITFTFNYCIDLHETEKTPVVVFTDHPDVVEGLVEKLRAKGFSAEGIHGGVDSDERFNHATSFQERKLNFIVLTIGAGSTGFNLFAGRHLIFNDRAWVTEDNHQALKRIHRIGQTKKCVIHNILGSKQDALINKALKEKGEIIDEAFKLL